MKGILALMLASGMALGGAVLASDGLSLETMLDNTTAKEFARLNGISEIVYDCAYNLLKDESVDSLVSLIEDQQLPLEEQGRPSLTTAVRECIYLDPLGWHGTENEWAIELLEIEKWER